MNNSKALLLPLLLLILLCSLSGCQGLLFYPSKEMVRTPADVELAYDDIYLKSLDGTKLNAWFLTVKEDVEIKGTVYFLHGNAQNISQHLASVYWLPEHGYQVFLLDYRGYGNSAGTPLLADVLTCHILPVHVETSFAIVREKCGSAIDLAFTTTSPSLKETSLALLYK